jgi:quinoprotein glucose dehydrogenase
MQIWVALKQIALATSFLVVALMEGSVCGDDRSPKPAYEPKVAAASTDGEVAIKTFRVPKELRVELVAAEPDVANPVAFWIDERGRFYVAETFRQEKGVEDNRKHINWLDDDLAAMTVEDRLAYFKRHLGEKVHEYETEHDRIRLLEDRDGDGKVDHATVFAGGFNGIVEGTGAGVLARRGTVWYTNIPKLWRLRDTDGDGIADERTALHHGYGVRVAFRGHDLHGLRFGPDGKLYFSIGDRGFNITTDDGRRLVHPDQGAVFRCNPDGSELEIVHFGLRNPQELAFDQFGNLFTCDNNSDSGDKARWVYVVEGGDSGWRMSYQYLADRGPWNREKLWHPQGRMGTPGRPDVSDKNVQPTDFLAAYIVPPIENISDGPSGLTFYPGVGLPERYANHFFLCDFRGTPANSGVRSFAVEPNGASFKLVDSQQFAWSILSTDCDFGPDGALYISDWVEGWTGPGKGRIYRLFDPDARDSAEVKYVRKLMADGFEKRSADELVRLLEHPHRDVRQEAQFALAERGPSLITPLAKVAANSKNPLARLHAIWGLGQIARRDRSALKPLIPLLGDADAEVVAQAAKVLGDAREPSAFDKLVALTKPEATPRVRFFAAYGAGKIAGGSGGTGSLSASVSAQSRDIRTGGHAASGTRTEITNAAISSLIEMLRDNADRDPYLRHAAAMGLVYACAALSPLPPGEGQGEGKRKPTTNRERPHPSPLPGGEGAVALSGESVAQLMAAAKDSSPAVRLGVLLALRRFGSAEVARFLSDSEPRIVDEAARAINDEPINEAMPALAALASRSKLSEPVAYRVINANFRLGQVEHAAAVADLAGRDDFSDSIRIEALRALADWEKPSGRDRVMGLWRPLSQRDAAIASTALRNELGDVFSGANDRVRTVATQVAGKLGINEVSPVLFELLTNVKQPADVRVEALRALAALKDKRLDEATQTALKDASGAVRAEARRVLAKSKPEEAVSLLEATLASNDSELVERQAAYDTLGDMASPAAEAILVKQLDELLAGRIAPDVQLDLLLAAGGRTTAAIKQRLERFEAARSSDDHLAAFREALAGGDAYRGRRLFFENAVVSCVRCHKVNGTGGEVGPDLSKLGGQQKRDYLLEALVDPNRQIAKGFESLIIATQDGKVVTGIVKEDTAEHLKLMTAEGNFVIVKKSDIDEQARGKSAMPEDVTKKLSKAEIRDLVEFLAGLK